VGSLPENAFFRCATAASRQQQVPFAVAAFLVKRQIGKIRRFFQFAILKINFR